MSKKLSIITINYNNLEGLKRTVASVVNQTWQELEYIVIDGGSTDGSAQFIDSQSDFLDYWISEKDSGIYNAMNKGIKVATGENLLFLNSGDYLLHNEVLALNHQYLGKSDLVCFDIKYINKNKDFIVSSPHCLRFSDMFYGTIPHQSTCIKKDLFDKVGVYDERLKIVSDWKFFILALFKYRCSYLKVDVTLSALYMDGISWQVDLSKDRDQVLNEYFSEYVLDYRQIQENKEILCKNNKILNSNRYKMLSEIEKTNFGRKALSILFRTYIFLFSKKKLKDIVN